MQDVDNKPSDNFYSETDLKEIFYLLINEKKIIISITAFISVIAVIYSLFLPNVYQSKAKLAPVDVDMSSISNSINKYSGLARLSGIQIPTDVDTSNSDQAILKIKSLSFFEKNILPNIFLPDLMAIKSWDHETNTVNYSKKKFLKNSNKWVRKYSYPQKQIPSSQESFEVFRDHHLALSEDDLTGFITLSVKHQSPYIAKQWTELIINEINNFYRQKDKIASQKAINFLNKQIAATNLSEIKEAIAMLLQEETQKLTLVEANEFYVFEYIDPPAIMEEKSEPSRALICILSALLGGIFSIIFVIVKSYFYKD
jgi:LPS O-antigen subunit length determinant protein (WzzB/FepE family)